MPYLLHYVLRLHSLLLLLLCHAALPPFSPWLPTQPNPILSARPPRLQSPYEAGAGGATTPALRRHAPYASPAPPRAALTAASPALRRRDGGEPTRLTLQYVGLPAQTAPTLRLRAAAPVFAFYTQYNNLAIPCFTGPLLVGVFFGFYLFVFFNGGYQPRAPQQDGAVFDVVFDRPRHVPLGLKIFKDGIFFERLSSCCE